MRALKYTMIDITRTKGQVIFMLLLGVLAYGFSFSAENIFSGIIYIMFAAIIMQGAVFTYEQKAELGFVNMLPGTDLDRVSGRFMTGVFLLVYGGVIALVIALVLRFQIGMDISYLPETFMIYMGLGLIFMAVQNVLFYLLGKGNSQQLMSFIHMIPGFAFWIIASVLLSILDVDGEKKSKVLIDIILWIEDNITLAGIVMLISGIIITCAGIFITEKVIRKKDFA